MLVARGKWPKRIVMVECVMLSLLITPSLTHTLSLSLNSLNHLSEDEQMNLAMQRSLEEQQQQQQQQNTCVLS